ncbi:MAG: DNA repair protein RadC [Sediminibacterium sp.]|nr:DNA repair protein RadC [Sediminibacterium sp.]
MSLKINLMAKEDQPKYKIETKGTQELTNAELLSILINSGTKELTAIDLAKLLLIKSNNQLQQIGNMNLRDFINLGIKGIGKSKATLIMAALEIGLRRQQEKHQTFFVNSSKNVAEYLKLKYQYYQHEILVLILLNRNNRIIKEEVIAEGGLSSTIVDIRMIFRIVFSYKATAFILCHNHPSGNPQNSEQDNLITQKIKQAAKLLDISFFDHIIVAKDGYFSYAEHHLI